MNNREINIAYLERIFSDAARSPVFKHNPKYECEGVPRVEYNDIMNSRYIIRSDKSFLKAGLTGLMQRPILSRLTTVLRSS